MNSLRIVLWITFIKLWITQPFSFSFRVAESEFLRLLRIAVSELFRLLSAVFCSSYINYYYLTYIYTLLILSSSSLKAFNIRFRNYSDFLSPRAASRRGIKSGTLKINPLIESFLKQNLPISGVYIKLFLIRFTAGLLLPLPPNLRTERLGGQVAGRAIPERMFS
jgi:hypothetical protein